MRERQFATEINFRWLREGNPYYKNSVSNNIINTTDAVLSSTGPQPGFLIQDIRAYKWFVYCALRTRIGTTLLFYFILDNSSFKFFSFSAMTDTFLLLSSSNESICDLNVITSAALS